MSISDLLFTFSSFFMALFPVINPLGSGFIVNGFLIDLSDQQRKSAIQKIIINYLSIGIGTLLIGHLFLLLFDLAIPVIQFGGGILICKAAMELLSDNGTSSDDGAKQVLDNFKWKEMQRKIFYPITFPISIGPGSISVIFTLMASANIKGCLIKTGINYSVIVLVIICMATIFYMFLTQGRRMMEKLGTAGNLIINKLVAFFTFCIGIQIIITGISKMFHLNIL